ncbi:hypothetical protein [Paenibacillus sp.]|jgi:hypothetical protein|uniref:hypothetical protein n=1 Tax=Paenibacillus sp. TaxID=58172 RepID=UPI002833B46C|nr:hypothetical protein [Paenibacillus sp.]MDR0269192.1 hypothetical protein [Paenibacillus sp.]
MSEVDENNYLLVISQNDHDISPQAHKMGAQKRPPSPASVIFQENASRMNPGLPYFFKDTLS